ncbi:UDP-4-amino-4,6-dideoxy-N-acetyl-beta-L-altrosamine transaminase [Flammeovirga sp. MY04]|uniref:UDP-4-amino-4, 6-dideoxy-N-acetyl-beta-L-altrosamine transaminase n=1 Tax=Flammeovirga sp. MY04 TaxID=1191459 RepID=UPI0008063AA6|nr:UDP-4-amino-4,6-dideoxy-N-acetyl-beta-L-altrosamine transaminase [Flammeovirga sp. MY04]ANQ50240.1 UDP-4-amino-4,6-dideoxy-N-acetyl-beta-L-altrosamine transaminase [Flammeovirga sp. MY04]
MKAIPYGRQDINEDDINAVVKALNSDFLTQGPEILEFEKQFSKYVGSKYAVAVANGTAALHLSILALGVEPGDKIITTPNTFAASANCIKYAGGEVVFSDIDPSTFLLDLNKVRALLKKHPKGTFKGIIPVDFAGYPVNLEEYKKLCDEYNLFLLEDACHAPGGAFYDSSNHLQKCGNGKFADAAIFSFHPVKHIAAGEGGMVTTNDENVYNKLLSLRTHGITKNPDVLEENHGGWYYEMVELGYNYRITDFQAALGKSQLDRAEKGIQRRNEIAQKYDKAFSASNVITPKVQANIDHAYHLYVIQVENRLGLYNHLRENNIFAQVHYIPLHKMPFYKEHNVDVVLPIAENYYKQCLSLPMYPTLTDDEQQFVIDKVLEFTK